MGKKSSAQINRMKKRAAARGEVYEPPPQKEEAPVDDGRKLAAARKLQKALNAIQNDEEMKSKERRSAKRKAEAIAAEEGGCSAEELLKWYQEHGATEVHEKKTKEKETKPRHNPCIVFVGQLSYDTTKEGLYNHIKKELGKEHEVTPETVQVRLLTHAKTKKSRGMAFVETTDPELLYACLKLHHTQLDGRRINVERTTGGKAGSEARKSKLTQLREEQAKLITDTVDKVLAEHLSTGELQEKELDDGVITLCKRHSPAVVEAALIEYIRTQGRDKDNPSSYLTAILRKFAKEGIEERHENKDKGGRQQGEYDRAKKRPRHSSNPANTELGVVGNKLESTSTFLQAGVDMSASDTSSRRDLSKIFPSMSRGRGRGRGYM